MKIASWNVNSLNVRLPHVVRWLDEAAPAAREVRKLVGEHLPGLVSTYTSIPRHLRGEASGGDQAAAGDRVMHGGPFENGEAACLRLERPPRKPGAAGAC